MNRRSFLSLLAKVPVVAGAAYLGLKTNTLGSALQMVTQGTDGPKPLGFEVHGLGNRFGTLAGNAMAWKQDEDYLALFNL